MELPEATAAVPGFFSYRVSVRQTWVSRVLLVPLGSSRYRQEWTWALTPSGSTSGCSVDTEDRYRGPQVGSACQILRKNR